MNPVLTAAKFCSKDSLERLQSFHSDLVAWAAAMQESGTADHEALYRATDAYLTFLADLGVLEQVKAATSQEPSGGS